MPEAAKKEAQIVYNSFTTFLKWLVIAGFTGAVGGVVGSVFNISVVHATALREANPWLLLLLPVGGAVIAAIYHFTKMEKVNTNTLIDSVHLGEKVPAILVPVIFVSTVITHVCGGSAGREGAALQIGGGIGNSVGGLFRLDEKDMRLATLCGMSAVFSALFGTPLTAALFALEVISVGVFYYSGLVPCIVSAVTAYGVSRLFAIAPTRFTMKALPLSADGLWRIAVMAILCAVMSSVFCLVMHGTDYVAERYLKNKFFRAVVGGVIILGLTWLVGTTDYNGAGVGPITNAIENGVASPDAFLWKLLFTAISLGCGFRGGEVVPTFFVGATLGCVVGPLLGIPAGFAAAVGLVAVFCGAVNCPIASIVLSIELFGSTELTYFAVACGISYMLSGYFGIYRSQKILYSKTRAEYINIRAK